MRWFSVDTGDECAETCRIKSVQMRVFSEIWNDKFGRDTFHTYIDKVLERQSDTSAKTKIFFY